MRIEDLSSYFFLLLLLLLLRLLLTFKTELAAEPAGLLVEREAGDGLVVGSRGESPPVATPADGMDFGRVSRIFLRLRRTLEEVG